MSTIEKLDSALIKQEKIPYTMHHNYVLQNIKDTTALAIWCYLTSLPDDWKVHRTQLMSHFNIGRDKLSNALKFLNDNYLLQYVQERIENGVFGEAYIKIKCGTDFKDYHELSTGGHIAAPLKNRTPVNPGNGKTAPTKEIDNNKGKKELTKETCDLPLWLDRKDWDDYKQHRKDIKKPLNKTAEARALAKLTRMKAAGQDIREIINESIINGWAGLFEPKKQGIGTSRAYSPAGENKSTVKFFEPGHPDYDRIHGTGH